ncbi:MAG: type II/IV secretion system ATPase subunit [Thermoplasmatota archaeon]
MDERPTVDALEDANGALPGSRRRARAGSRPPQLAQASSSLQAAPAATNGARTPPAPAAPAAPANPAAPTAPPARPELPDQDAQPLETVSDGWRRIHRDDASGRWVYEVTEPRLTDTDKERLAFIRDSLLRTLPAREDPDADANNDAAAAKEPRDPAQERARRLDAAIQTIVRDHGLKVDDEARRRLGYHLRREFLGYGPIDVPMHDPDLEDLSCDGPDVPLYVVHRRLGSLRTNIVFEDELELDGFVIGLAQRSGKHISVADPMLDATLPDGSRLQATLSREVTSRGSSFTIRRFREEPMTAPELIAGGTLSPEMAAYFWLLVEEGRSLLYAGGTASGKTTSLNAVAQFIPRQAKVVSLEDTREINLQHENWIAAITRGGQGSRQGSRIDLFRLLEGALRQRPEYILVGEVRGKEAFTLFQAMATGHAVCSTMHADSVASAVYRLENEPINVPRMMLRTLDTVAIQSHVQVGGRSARRIREVVEIVGFDPDTEDLLTNTVFQWDPDRDVHDFTGRSQMLADIAKRRGWSELETQQEWDRRTQVLAALARQGLQGIRPMHRVLAAYARDPEGATQRVLEGATWD